MIVGLAVAAPATCAGIKTFTPSVVTTDGPAKAPEAAFVSTEIVPIVVFRSPLGLTSTIDAWSPLRAIADADPVILLTATLAPADVPLT